MNTMRDASAKLLLNELIKQKLITPNSINELLGLSRNSVNLSELEDILLLKAVLTNRSLKEIKSTIFSAPSIEDSIGGLPILTEVTARTYGAVVLDLEVPSVAFVEPTPETLEIISTILDNKKFASYVLSSLQFKNLIASTYKKSPILSTLSNPETPSIYIVLDECIAKAATDIHIQVASSPAIRVNGSLVPLPYAPVDSTWITREIASIAPPLALEKVGKDFSYDFAYTYGQYRFRINLGSDRRGLTLTARILSPTVPSMEELGLPSAVREFTNLERGLVLITGPTGSGKSTTLAALLEHIAQTQSRHIITLEDPIEYLLSPGATSIVNQREAGSSFNDFSTALRQSLRQDPDVILVGEMRDAETAKTAVTAAETGHLVFSTLHTYDVQSTVARLVSMYSEGEQEQARDKLSYILKGVVSQTLVPRASKKGRIAALEIMTSTPAIANNLRNPAGTSQLRSTIQTSRKEGMQTMEMDLASLVLQGAISQEEAEFRCRDKAEFLRYLSNLG